MGNMDVPLIIIDSMKKNPDKKNTVTLLKKAATKVRYGMTIFSISSILQRIGIELTPYVIFQESINVPALSEIIKTDSEYPFELLGPDDIKVISKWKTGFSEAEMLSLFDSGGKCFGIKHHGNIVAFSWIDFNEMSYKSTKVRLKSNEAYLWYMFTLESYRGKNLAPYLRYKCYEILKEMNRDVFYSITDYFNSPSMNFKKKLNAKRLKLILYIKLFKKYSRSFTLKTYK